MRFVIIILLISTTLMAQNRLRYTATEGTWISVDVSPDGQSIAFDLLGHIYTMPISGGNAKVLTSGTSWNMFPRFSPDGQELLYTSDAEWSNDLWTMSINGSSKKNISKMKRPVFQGTWSRDGQHIYGTGLNMRVRFPAYQFNRLKGRRMLLPPGGRTPVNHFNEYWKTRSLYYVHQDGSIPRSGPRVKRYSMVSGESEVYIDRPGGAASIRIHQPSGKMAYIHKNDKVTELIIHDLNTQDETVIASGLDYGRFESRSFYGAYPNIAWTPDGTEVIVWYGGKIHAINVNTKADRVIEFKAPVNRQIANTFRFKLDIPEDKRKTHAHRWAQRTKDGILYEALGELWLKRGSSSKNLTKSTAHEISPVYVPATNRIYYATWDDEKGGALVSASADFSEQKIIHRSESQIGSISVDKTGSSIFFYEGGSSMKRGVRLEQQTDFWFQTYSTQTELKEPKTTRVTWSRNRYAKRPPVSSGYVAKAGGIVYADYQDDQLVLKRRFPSNNAIVAIFPNATRAHISPDGKWVFFREYHRSFIAPFDYMGQPIKYSASDGYGECIRVDDQHDGDFTEWDSDSQGLHWTRGKFFYEKSLKDILAGNNKVEKTNLSMELTIAKPSGKVLLKNARVLTMNAKKEVLEGVDILIDGHEIDRIGKNLNSDGAKVYDLTGKTIMPGMFDAHGHYGSPISALNVIEQHHYGLKANLAYGVTTMYDVYGTTQKDFWISDMIDSGKMDGPRIYSVGDPIFVTKYRTKMHRSIYSLKDALEHAQFNKDHGATALKDYSNHERGARRFLAQASKQLKLNLVTESFANPQMNFSQLVDGLTGIEHTIGLEPLYDDVHRLFKATQVGITPTLVVVYNGPSGQGYFDFTERYWEDQKLLNFFRKDYLLRFRRSPKLWKDDYYWAQMGKTLVKLYRDGVLMQMGAHGQMMGLGAHWEMELFTHGGFTPYEAIEIATINGFKHHGLDHKLGSIEEGKFADLVILNKNPLENIRHTREIDMVMKNGMLYSGFDASRIYPKEEKAAKMYFKE